MTIIKEYRIPLPITVAEYQVGQLYSVAEASKDNTGGGEGVEVVKNEPYENETGKGQFTHKVFRMGSKVPLLLRKLLPKGSTTFHEHAWNAYPHCKTVITQPDYMKEKMECKIETWHKEDLGEEENVHGLNKAQLKEREVILIDIVKDPIPAKDYKADADPSKYTNAKDANRAALPQNWLADLKTQRRAFIAAKSANADGELPYMPKHMTAYKLVTIKFQWFGLQNRIEKFSHGQQRRIFTLFHRQVYCWLDKWVDMTMADIRALEDSTKKDLEENIDKGEKKGFTGGDDES